MTSFYGAIVCVLVMWGMDMITKFLCLPIAWSPMVLCPLVGLLLGDFKTGLILGGSLQAIFLGVIGIGGVVPADKRVASIITTAFVILGGLDIEAGIAIAYTIGVLSNTLSRFATPLFAGAEPYWKKLADQADSKKYNRFFLFWFFCISLLPQCLIIFFSVLLGTDAVAAVVNVLPRELMTGLQAASSMMTAVGIGICLKMSWSKEFAGFFFIGWIAASVLKFSAIQLAIVAVSVATLWYFTSNTLKDKYGQKEAQRGGDFF